ncbi:hypothetical protein BFX40_20460 [Mesorhizobium sp. SEMIA 3007]|uniref:hypothetical protein n=1 Tax=Mesorhizobium sp. SEMIA 3007 TaxID=1862350 RepID=UPI00083E5FDE|nr:hypothetical protein [Mesorhizobium sp. SEMIA 3007]ODA95003.1 hypothetical protein BFX40_20460 [Mesorhizobium sp. SEMIA 3007]
MIVLSGLIGAFIGAAITLFFNMWKFHRDERSARCDELCAAINAASVVAADYWANDFKLAPDQRVQEARLLGAQALIDGLFDDLRSVVSAADGAELDDVLSNLFEQFTGGAFSVKDRPPDPARLSASIQAASEAVIAIRRSHRRTFPLARLFSAYHDNRLRVLDMRQTGPSV